LLATVSRQDALWCPPIVQMTGGTVGHLLAWELCQQDGSWRAWVSWVQQSGGLRGWGVRVILDPSRLPRGSNEAAGFPWDELRAELLRIGPARRPVPRAES
jgi:hypothetical protein